MRAKTKDENAKSKSEDKMKKLRTIAIVVSLLGFFAASSFAQPPQRMMRANRMFDRAPNRILLVLKSHQEDLEITDSQMEQIQNLVFSHQENMLKMRNDLDTQHLELQKLMQDRDNLDYDKIKAILSKTSAVRSEMFIERLKQRDEINKILTPEQRDALKAMVQEGFGRRFERMRDRGQRPRRFPMKRRGVIR